MESSGPSVSVRAAAARLAARAVRLKSSAEAESTTDLSMKKVLGAFDLLLLGVGGVVGGGCGPSRSIPEDLVCPISHELMVDPVLAADGHAYERSAIEQWLTRSHTSPLTGEPLPSATLLPCHASAILRMAWR